MVASAEIAFKQAALRVIYNLSLGRFLTQDSLIPDVTNGQALNAYAYVYNDPVNMVDPSGNIPGLGGVGSAIGDAVVGGAKRVPDAWKPGIRNAAQKGNDFINNWYSLPDDCGCEASAGNTNRGLEFANNWPLNQAFQFGWSNVTTPGRRVASEVVVRASGASSNLVGVKTNYNVTAWGIRGPVSNPHYTVSHFGGGYTVRAKSGLASIKVRNPRWQWAKGNTGALGSFIGTGLIDGAFQLIGDTFVRDLCLSPNQLFWRAFTALGFGLIAGGGGLALGTVVVGVWGATGTALGISYGAWASFGGGLVTTILLNQQKQRSIDRVTGWVR